MRFEYISADTVKWTYVPVLEESPHHGFRAEFLKGASMTLSSVRYDRDETYVKVCFTIFRPTVKTKNFECHDSALHLSFPNIREAAVGYRIFTHSRDAFHKEVGRYDPFLLHQLIQQSFEISVIDAS